MHEYIRKLLYKDLSKITTEKVHGFSLRPSVRPFLSVSFLLSLLSNVTLNCANAYLFIQVLRQMRKLAWDDPQVILLLLFSFLFLLKGGGEPHVGN